jgi:hypothetical protein
VLPRRCPLILNPFSFQSAQLDLSSSRKLISSLTSHGPSPFCLHLCLPTNFELLPLAHLHLCHLHLNPSSFYHRLRVMQPTMTSDPTTVLTLPQLNVIFPFPLYLRSTFLTLPKLNATFLFPLNLRSTFLTLPNLEVTFPFPLYLPRFWPQLAPCLPVILPSCRSHLASLPHRHLPRHRHLLTLHLSTYPKIFTTFHPNLPVSQQTL